jgi:alpha-tubulin suppressor-like RCC1 family protein
VVEPTTACSLSHCLRSLCDCLRSRCRSLRSRTRCCLRLAGVMTTTGISTLAGPDVPVTVVAPEATAEIVPSTDTVATPGSDEAHSIEAPATTAPPASSTVAEIRTVSPTPLRSTVGLESTMESACCSTVTMAVSLAVPAVATMAPDPLATAVTTPPAVTDATPGAVLVHVTAPVRICPSWSNTMTPNCRVSPTNPILNEISDIETVVGSRSSRSVGVGPPFRVHDDTPARRNRPSMRGSLFMTLYVGRRRKRATAIIHTRPARSVAETAGSVRRAVLVLGLLSTGACGPDQDPVRTPDPETGRFIVAISAGSDHTCALDRDGSAYCWGANDKGQLGNGSIVDAPSPRLVSVGEPIVQISAGFGHSCGLTEGGIAYCWGDNTFGQLGDGTLVARIVPTRVSGVPALIAISAGGVHSCGWTAAGDGYCWGDNESGQLGDGTSTARSVPTAVSGGLGFRQMHAGLRTTCGVSTSDFVYCWGNNEAGLLRGMTEPERLIPTEAQPGLEVLGMVLGQRHACVFTGTGRAACWGNNEFGQLGAGAGDQRTFPLNIGTADYTQLSAGARADHTCGVTELQIINCWGQNLTRQSAGIPSAAAPPSAVAFGRSIYRLVATGRTHSCAVDIAGLVWCWGSNARGQSGFGADFLGSAASAQDPRLVLWDAA